MCVINEREKQDNKWGDQTIPNATPPLQWLAILTEEVGELAEQVLNYGWGNPDALHEMWGEAVQVTAVSLAILESIAKLQGEEVSKVI